MDPDTTTITEARECILTGMRIAEVRRVDKGVPFVIVPQDTDRLSLEKLLPAPIEKRGIVAVTELESFIRYTKEFGEAGTRIFALITETSALFEAVLDYHEAKGGDPRWGRHRVVYSAVQSPEWKRWFGNHAKWHAQTDFATFIEDNVGDIVDPSGAEMLEIAKTLEAKSAVSFKSGVRLDNGDHQISFQVETKSAAGANGELKIPSEFQLGIAPFVGAPSFKVRARLRYRIEEQHLKLRYDLITPHKVIEATCQEMTKQIHSETDVQPLAGSAPTISAID